MNKSFCNSSGIDQGYWSPLIHYTSSETCKDSVKNSSRTTNCVAKGKNEVQVSNDIKHQVKNLINLVDKEPEVLQWPNFFSVEPTNDYSNRWFPEGVGSSLQRGSNIRAMVRGGENRAYKCAGTISNNIHSLSDWQQGSPVLPFESGRNKERTNDQILALIWHYLLNHNVYHSKILAFSTEYSSRQGIKEKNRPFRVASSFQGFSRGFLTTRFSDNRFLCSPPMPSTTFIYTLPLYITVMERMQW